MTTPLPQLEPEIESPRTPEDTNPEPPVDTNYPSPRTVITLAVFAVILVGAAFFAGWLPRSCNAVEVNAETNERNARLPVATVIAAKRDAPTGELTLPVNIQAVTEAPILARASGYMVKRYADIGDRVKVGQILGEVEAPELDQQVQQAKATVLQLQATVRQAQASEEQGKVQQDLARVTAQRFGALLTKGAVSRQENDQYQTQYLALTTNVQALNSGIAAARQNLAAAEANLARLTQLQSYKQIRAPFTGVVTLRNIDIGALISAGQTLLFRVAQTERLRAYINVPQSEADSVRGGQSVSIRIPESAQEFSGKISRTSSALDPSSRTLLAEVEFPNVGDALMPGTYGQVIIRKKNTNPPLIIPGGTLIIGPKGTQVAIVQKDGTVAIRDVVVARDLGQTVEIASGLNEGDLCVNNPDDDVRPGVRVEARRQEDGKE